MMIEPQFDIGLQSLMLQVYSVGVMPWSRPKSLPSPASPRIPTYAELVHETNQRMGQRGCKRIRIPHEYNEKQSKNGNFRLSAYAWNIRESAGWNRRSLAELRMVFIQGQKNQILNTWIFPIDPRNTPVFAAELIGIGGQNKVAFVDIQGPVLDPSLAKDISLLTEALSSNFACLPCNEAPPSWATDASLGGFTYARQADPSWTSTIMECYRSYLDTYLKACLPARSHCMSSVDEMQGLQRAQQELLQYQHHHMDSSPGKKFLGSLFGEEWTSQFMLNFLFSTPKGIV